MLLTIGDKCDKTMIYPIVAISSAIEDEDVHDDLRKHISERLDIYIYICSDRLMQNAAGWSIAETDQVIS